MEKKMRHTFFKLIIRVELYDCIGYIIVNWVMGKNQGVMIC